MKYGGIDFGNGYTKVCFDDHQECFPSLVAKSHSNKWGSGETSVGFDAARDAQNIGYEVVSPIILGTPILKDEFNLLVKKAVSPIVSTGEEFSVCAGLPYDAISQKQTIISALRSAGSVKQWIVPQAFGTAIYEELTSCIICSIGWGTTEWLIVNNGKPTWGKSDDMAVSHIVSETDKTGADYVDRTIFEHPDAKKKKIELADHIIYNYKKISMKEKKPYTLLFSGGGILVQDMKELFYKSNIKFDISDDPVNSNALGMKIHAKRMGEKEFNNNNNNNNNKSNF